MGFGIWGLAAIAILNCGTTAVAGERQILAALEEARNSGDVYLEVPAADGQMLRLLAEAAGARNVVEIGTSTGYAALWLCLALEMTGGKLTTFEIDRKRLVTARRRFQQAGVERIVTIVEGDAHENVKRLKEPIDLIYLDADKDGYSDYLNKLLPLVRPGGLILAHNIDSAEDYEKAVASRADLDTVFYMSGAGLGITLKKR